MKIRFIGPKSHPGWRGVEPHYKVECDRHGVIYTYPHGYDRRLECPICALMRWDNE